MTLLTKPQWLVWSLFASPWPTLSISTPHHTWLMSAPGPLLKLYSPPRRPTHFHLPAQILPCLRPRSSFSCCVREPSLGPGQQRPLPPLLSPSPTLSLYSTSQRGEHDQNQWDWWSLGMGISPTEFFLMEDQHWPQTFILPGEDVFLKPTF